MEQRGSSASSIELDILQLTQQWEAHRTICNGDTPGDALRKGTRPALAPIPPNVAAAAGPAVNPFSLTAQRHKASASGLCQQQQQPSVRFAFSEPTSSSKMAAASEAAGAAVVVQDGAPAPAATPAALPPASVGKVVAAAGGASASSPSPYVLFRGRLSFAAEADSARKFDRPTTARKPAATLKRKLLISPGADMTAAFPTLRKPAAKQRRRSLSDVADAWASRVAEAAADAAAEEAAAEDAAEGGSGLDNYWSDPLPLPQSVGRAAVSAGAGEDDMQDTAASPASSSGGCCSPGASGAGMDTCCWDTAAAPPAFSPLPGGLCHALPTVDHPDCGFPSISPRTMRDLLLHGAGAFGLSGFAVIDCRYDYEFEGGRLPGALHLTTPEALEGLLGSRPEDHWGATALIFHCEFSTERGPRAAKYVRNKDREAHMHDYPALSQPHIFVLQGGYKAFWRQFPDLCEGGYTPMDHPDYSDQLKACHNVVKKAWAKTTRTYSRKQRQLRPSYRLRQSTDDAPGGGSRGSSGRGAVEAGAEERQEQEGRVPPSLLAARHVKRT